MDYQGEEVKVARYFAWSNIAPAILDEVGSVPLVEDVEVCEHGGCKYFVDNVDLFLKPREMRGKMKAPRVMVEEKD